MHSAPTDENCIVVQMAFMFVNLAMVFHCLPSCAVTRRLLYTHDNTDHSADIWPVEKRLAWYSCRQGGAFSCYHLQTTRVCKAKISLVWSDKQMALLAVAAMVVRD